MKTKLISLTLLLILSTSIILTGCSSPDNKAHFGKGGPKEYQIAQNDSGDRQILKSLEHKLPTKGLQDKQGMKGFQDKQVLKGS